MKKYLNAYLLCCVSVIVIGVLISGCVEDTKNETVIEERDISKFENETVIEERAVFEKPIAQVDFLSIIPESFKTSPNSKRVAYVARTGNKQFVVVDGEEGKRYDGIMKGTPIFSPDSKRVAYVAEVDNKQFVVVDGEEGKRYDSISPIIFDSPNSLHYLAQEYDKLYLVEEKINAR